MTDAIAALAKMREPFPANQISKLPKPYKRDSPKGKCNECGGYHGLPAVHLDYVGHAALTDRLLDADPMWTWEPATPDGLPALDRNNGMWIRLTIAGVTRLGYGSADGKSGGDAVKEVIGDALRNAAMRFGAALDLWHKGDLHAAEEDEKPEQRQGAAKQQDTSRQEARQQDTPAASQTPAEWAQKQIVFFEGCKDVVDRKKLRARSDDPRFTSAMDRLKQSDNTLWRSVVQAETAANGRCDDDVPF